MILLPFYCDTDRERARETMRGPVEWFYNKVAAHQQTSAGGVVRGYEVTMTEGRKAREQGYLAFEKLVEHGACIAGDPDECIGRLKRSEEHTSELQSLMRSSYAVFCLKKKKNRRQNLTSTQTCTTN